MVSIGYSRTVLQVSLLPTPMSWHALNGQLKGLSIEQREQIDMTSLFSLLTEAGAWISGVPTHAPWGEIDCPSDVQLYERIYPRL
ncbi:hypothetical protein SB766_14400 [Pseudomonas sp. SIMBA_077]